MLNKSNWTPSKQSYYTEVLSESVSSNYLSATTPSTTMTTTTSTNKDKKAEHHVRSQLPSSAIQFDNNVDCQTKSTHDTALTIACAGRQDSLIQLLLDYGADIEHKNKRGFSPLMIATIHNFEDIVKILLDNNANVEVQFEKTRDTPLTFACRMGFYEVCKLLLQKGAKIEHRNVSDHTPLCYAAEKGFLAIIKLLVDNGAEINSQTGSTKRISPLMLATTGGHIDAVKLLLEMGSDVNLQLADNANTALTLACFADSYEIVKLLLDRGANVDHQSRSGCTALMEAAANNYVQVGRLLIEKGADIYKKLPHTEVTALAIALRLGHGSFVNLLLGN